MSEVETIAALFLAVGAIGGIASAVRLPQYVVLVLSGLALGLIPGLPEVQLEPDVVFLLFLPPILYRAGFEFAAHDIKPLRRAIGLLAIGLVAATIFVIAAVAHFALGLSWPVAFVLGAVVAPTDPVAATAVIRRTGAPDRLSTILEGESLINDATALAALSIAIGTLGAATFSVGEAALELVWTALVGIAIGLMLGWLASQARARSGREEIEITSSIVATYGGFLAADLIGASGILASVVAGLVIGSRAPQLGTARTRLQADSFWRVIAYLVESALFLLIGLGFGEVVASLSDSPAALIGQALLVGLGVLAIRVAWMYSVPSLAHLFDRGDSQVSPEPSAAEKLVLSVAGIRGAVTVAAALSVPLLVDGEPFAQRDTILFLAFTTVLLTLVLPALGLPALLRRLGLADNQDARERVSEAERRLANAAIERAEEIAEHDGVSADAIARARESYEMRLARAEEGAGQSEDGESARAYRDVRRRLIEAEREELGRIRREGTLPGNALRELELGLDVEESRLER